MKELKAALTIRGDCLYCPLCLQIDSYWNCKPNCYHCGFRRLNRTWGTKQRLADPEHIRKKLHNGQLNLKPKSSLAWALRRKKTIRVGSKSDPYQPAENKYRITQRILRVLIDLDWSFVIQTRFTHILMRDEDLLDEAHAKGLLTIMPVISPGGEDDWELLERGRTTPIPARLKHIKRWVKRGFNIGVNGEPFIPGYHRPQQFTDMVRRLKKVGVKSYNTYNLHGNDLVYKNLHKIGLDIERIWRYNKDKQWKIIQAQLCDIAEVHGIRLGCPDWFNVPKQWVERANTCCGIHVPRPSKFNTHHWRHLKQKGYQPFEIVHKTWEGIGDKKLGSNIIKGAKVEGRYTL